MSSARQLSMESSALAYEIQQRGAAMMDHGDYKKNSQKHHSHQDGMILQNQTY